MTDRIIKAPTGAVSIKSNTSVTGTLDPAGGFGTTTNGAASATTSGLVTTGAQTLAGVKTFSSNPVVGGLTAASTAGIAIAGKTDGAAVAAGAIGEIMSFTTRTVSAVSGGSTWNANASALATLTAGLWLIYPKGSCAAGSSTNSIFAMISTNNTNDSSGSVADGLLPNRSSDGLAKGPIHSASINVSGTQALYAKASATTSNVGVDIGGFAVRIA